MMVINFVGRHEKLTLAMKDYLQEKLTKRKSISSVIQKIEAVVEAATAHKGKNNDFKLTLRSYLPQLGYIEAEREGADYYSLVDETTQVLSRLVQKKKKA